MWQSSRTKLQRQSYPQLKPHRHTPEIAASLSKAISQALPEALPASNSYRVRDRNECRPRVFDRTSTAYRSEDAPSGQISACRSHSPRQERVP